MDRWRGFNKALSPFNISETSSSKSEAHTCVLFSSSCFTIKGKNAKAFPHKSQGIKIPSLLLVLGDKLALCSLPKPMRILPSFLPKLYGCALWPLRLGCWDYSKVSLMGETRRKCILGYTWRLQDHLVFCQRSPKIAPVPHIQIVITTWCSQRVSTLLHFCSHFKLSLRLL